jgi:hypothetical protein
MKSKRDSTNAFDLAGIGSTPMPALPLGGGPFFDRGCALHPGHTVCFLSKPLVKGLI